MAPVVPLMRARAEAVEVPPIKRSLVMFKGATVPCGFCQKLARLNVLRFVHWGSPLVKARICPFDPALVSMREPEVEA